MNTRLYLENLAKDTIKRCTFTKKTNYFDKETTLDILLPSGDNTYPSFWVRDCVMMAESGLVENSLLKQYIEVFATHGQNGGETLLLENSLSVPPYAIADHINYDAKPVYFPGTYSSGCNQGNGDFGFLPPLGDSYYFIHAVYYYIKQSGEMKILSKIYSGMTLAERIEKAFTAYCIDSETQLCRHDDAESFPIDWGFADTVTKSGYMLFPSVLRACAARMLAELFSADSEKSSRYSAIYKTITEHIPKIFLNERGWLNSATGICRQSDVWGTVFAIYCDILPKEIEKICCDAVMAAYINGSATLHAAVRQILTTEDYGKSMAWEKTNCPYPIYQNGGYWNTATGWYYAALYKKDPSTAEKFINEFITYTEAENKGKAPYEWFIEDGRHGATSYGTSGVLPFIGYKKING